MASELKKRSMAQHDSVVAHNKSLDTTGEQIDANQASMDKTNESLREQIRKMSGSSCAMCLMMMLVIMLFVCTFVVMKTFKKKATLGGVRYD